MLWYEVLLRLGLSVLFGLIIGFERERRHRPAGIKTHVLVCIGAALVSLIQIYMVEEAVTLITADPSLAAALKSDYGRLGAQVISGIGFLGAGAILKTKGSIHGLTTASTLWIAACLGLSIGMGYYYISMVALAFIVLVLFVLQMIQNLIQKNKGLKKIEVTFSNKKVVMNFINEYCIFRNIAIKSIDFAAPSDEKSEFIEKEIRIFTYEYTLVIPRNISLNSIIAEMQMENDIISAVDSSKIED